MRRRTAGGLAALLVVLLSGAPAGASEPLVQAAEAATAVPTRDIAYDAERDLLYASVPSTGGALANTVVALDPVTGALQESVFVGSNPGEVALSDDGSALYVGLLGATSLVRIDTATFTVVDTTILRVSGVHHTGPAFAEDIEVKVGDPDVVLVSLFLGDRSPRHVGVIAIDDGTILPVSTPGHTGANSLTGGPDANTFYGHNNETSSFDLFTLTLASDGVRITENATELLGWGFAHSIEHLDGRVYSTTGVVADPVGRAVTGTYDVPGAIEPVAALDRTFVLRSGGLYEFHRTRFTLLGVLPLADGDSAPAMELVSTGAGLAGIIAVDDAVAGSPFQIGQLVLFTLSTEPPAPTFSDIVTDAHAASIVAIAEAGIAAGYPDGTFRPGVAVTRGQMASFLVSALGLPAAGSSALTDISGHAHEANIRALAASGITVGYPDGSFRPDAPVSREQMASFLDRSFDFPAAERVAPFDDLGDRVHADAVDDLYAAGITSGTGGGRFSPEAPVTRGQMATFLGRSLGLVDVLPAVGD